jgi:nucleoside-diphosphate-sugar epimerase
MKKILITGGTGFLGNHLINLILDKNIDCEIYIFSSTTNYQRKDNNKLKYITVDIFNYDLLKKHKLEDISVIYHLAGKIEHSSCPNISEELYNINVIGTLNIIKWANYIDSQPRIIVASTSGVVACHPIFIKQKNLPDETAKYSSHALKLPYYKSKIDCEKKALNLAKKYKLDIIFIRPTMILGPDDLKGRATSRIKNFLLNNICLTADGILDFIDVRDLVHVFYNVMNINQPNKYYNCGGTSMSVSDFYSNLQILSNQKKIQINLPYNIALIITTFFYYIKIFLKLKVNFLPDPVVVKMGYSNWSINSTLAKTNLGLTNRPFEETLKDTIEWHNSKK